MAGTMKDIARETGLSLATISKYMNGGPVRENNRASIERAIARLDYTVNEYARGLKSNKSHTIGVVIPELSNLFVTQIITKMEELLRAQGYSVIICDCHTDAKLECEAVRFLLSKMVDGIVNMPVCQDGHHLKAALEKKIPILLIDRTLPILEEVADCVVVDNVRASENAVLHFLQNGHRQIGIIVGPSEIYTSKQRLLGYANALAEFGCSPNERLIVHGDYTLQGGYQGMQTLLRNRPEITAVFVTNYEMTLGAVIAANEMGIKIPADVSFIGFDNMDLSRIANPKLTIVTQPLEEIGIQAAKTMLARLAEPAHHVPLTIVLSTSLQHGDSVRSISVYP